MVRRLLGLVLVCIVGGCTPIDVQAPSFGQPNDLASKTVALVEVDEDGDGRAYCSGVWVDEHSILTAAHCVEEFAVGDGLSYLTKEDLNADKSDEINAARKGILEARDERHDLALIYAPKAPYHQVSDMAPGSPYVGEQTQTMGQSLGLLWYSYSTGVVSAVRTLEGEDGKAIWWVQTTAPVSPGNSGGGLFNMDGELLGICHGTFLRGQNLNTFVHEMYVKEFLRAQYLRRFT